MGRFETFDHTADVGIRVEAETLDDLFATAAEGLVSLVVANPEGIRDEPAGEVGIEAEDSTELMLAWLSEVLFRIETRQEVYARCEVEVDGEGTRLRARLFGEGIDIERHVLDHEVKAVTRHGAWVRREDAGWKAEVVVDI